MASRGLKQLIYGVLYLVVFGGLAFSIYFFNFRVGGTCVDLQQNQHETGVDCGGECVSCEIKNLVPIKVGSVSIFNSGSVVNTLTQVWNLNSSYGARRFNYTLSLYDESGNLLKSFEKVSLVYPAEFKYVLDTGLDFGGVIPTRATFRVKEVFWEPIATLARPRVSYRGIKVETQASKIAVSGLVVNENPFALRSVAVQAIIFASSTHPDLFSKTAINYLIPGEERPFTVFIPITASVAPIAPDEVSLALEPAR